MPYLGNEVAPLVQALEGKELKLDSDGDSSIQASVDDTVVVKTNSNTALNIDANGHITKPLQPAFQVHPSGTISNLPINTDNAITFGTERFDNNGDFASNTFTAPVTGKYQLNLILYFVDMQVDAAYVETYIITSNKTYYLIVDPSSFDQVQSYYTFDAGILADMDANDTCVIKVRQSGGTNQTDVSAATNFSGYLVC